MSGSPPDAAGAEAAPSAAGQDARRHLHCYLETFGLPPGRHRDDLVQRLLARAASRLPGVAQERLGSAALEVADAELGSWFGRVLDREALEDRSPLLLGRAAFRLCGGGRRWPDVLLSDEVPSAFVDAMRNAVPTPTPPEEQGAMVDQAFESWSVRDLAPARLVRILIAGSGRQAIAS